MIVGMTVLSLVLTGVAFTMVDKQFMPSSDEGQFRIGVEMPPGTALAETDRVVGGIERMVAALKEVDAVFATSSQGGTGFDGQASSAGNIEVQLVPKARRSRSTEQVMEAIRQKISGIPGANITVEAGGFMQMSTGGSPISILLKGQDSRVLEEISARVVELISSVPGTRQVRTDIEARLPEAQVFVDREKAAAYGLTTYQVASAVRSALTGQVSTNYRVGGDEISVRLRLPEQQRKQLAELRYVKIPTPIGARVTLEEIARIDLSVGPTVINREDQSRVVRVTGAIAGRDLAGVVRDIHLKLRTLTSLPPGYSWEFGGAGQEMAESFADLGQALLLAMLIIYMLLAAQFESLLQPLVIMLTVPLSAVGAVWGLFLTGRPLTTISYTGFIMLVGIAVNNGIVLIEYVNILRRRDGMSRMEALLKAGPKRLRPILMTSLTTVLGLVPLCLGLGESAETEAPLATVIAAGLATSTVLTLVVIPVVYEIIERLSDWLSRKVYGKRPAATAGRDLPATGETGGN